MPDETCLFLTADFDDKDWARDALAYLETCRLRSVPAALERSRSGKGGHVWIFFAEPIFAREARQLGAMLLTATMERRPEIGFASYDRLFPSQDTMPAGGFGNLIALPLQRRAREQGNSLFVDDDLRPFDDQWAFLSSLRCLDRATVTALVAEAETRGAGVLGVRSASTASSCSSTSSKRWSSCSISRRSRGGSAWPSLVRTAVTGPDDGRIWDRELVRAVMRIAGNGTGETRWKVLGLLDWASRTYNPFGGGLEGDHDLYASDRDGAALRATLVHGVSLSWRGSGRLVTRLDTPPSSDRRHPAPGIALPQFFRLLKFASLKTRCDVPLVPASSCSQPFSRGKTVATAPQTHSRVPRLFMPLPDGPDLDLISAMPNVWRTDLAGQTGACGHCVCP